MGNSGFARGEKSRGSCLGINGTVLWFVAQGLSWGHSDRSSLVQGEEGKQRHKSLKEKVFCISND